MSGPHEPDATFVTCLEWQTRTRLRRAHQFGTEPVRRWRAGIRSVALIVLSMLGGGAGVLAAEQIQQSRERALLLEQAGIEWDLAVARRDLIGDSCARVRALFKRGLASSMDTRDQERRLREAVVAERLLALDLEEVQATGRAARRDLAAPLVNGRDLVAERLRIKQQALSEETDAQHDAIRRLQALFDAGRVSRDELGARQKELAGIEREIDRIDRSLELRRAFLADEIDATEVRLRARRERSATQLDGTRFELERTRNELDRVTRLQANGLVDAAAVRQAELEVHEAETAARLAEIEIELLDGKLRSR